MSLKFWWASWELNPDLYLLEEEFYRLREGPTSSSPFGVNSRLPLLLYEQLGYQRLHAPGVLARELGLEPRLMVLETIRFAAGSLSHVT